jgi:hypothetical protein
MEPPPLVPASRPREARVGWRRRRPARVEEEELGSGAVRRGAHARRGRAQLCVTRSLSPISILTVLSSSRVELSSDRPREHARPPQRRVRARVHDEEDRVQLLELQRVAPANESSRRNVEEGCDGRGDVAGAGCVCVLLLAVRLTLTTYRVRVRAERTLD